MTSQKTVHIRKDIGNFYYFLYATLRVILAVILVPVGIFAFLSVMVVGFNVFLPEKITNDQIINCFVSVPITVALLYIFSKSKLLAFHPIEPSEELDEEVDSIKLTNLSRQLIISGFVWLLPAILFGIGVYDDYPNQNSALVYLLIFSIFLSIVTIRTGYQIKVLRRREWNWGMILSIISCFNVPVGTILGLNNLRVLQKTKEYFK